MTFPTTHAVLLALASTALFACDKSADPATTSTTSTTGTNVNAPDNTKTNARDNGNTAAVTPLDQGNNTADLQTTQAIRKALMSDDALSSTAKNVKIVTSNGTVTLRGPVTTAAEKLDIEAKAKAAAGANVVADQLDVEAAK